MKTRLIFATITALGLSTAIVSQALAGDDFVCDSGTCWVDDDVDGNVIVTNGATALLQPVTVSGNVIVETGSSVSASGTTIEGNVQAEESVRVSLYAVDVLGDVQVKKSTWTVSVRLSTVGGNVQYEENGGRYTDLRDSKVFGDVQLFKNNWTLGSWVWNNMIGGNFQCKENTGGLDLRPGPGTSNTNTVAGNLECEPQ